MSESSKEPGKTLELVWLKSESIQELNKTLELV